MNMPLTCYFKQIWITIPILHPLVFPLSKCHTICPPQVTISFFIKLLYKTINSFKKPINTIVTTSINRSEIGATSWPPPAPRDESFPLRVDCGQLRESDCVPAEWLSGAAHLCGFQHETHGFSMAFRCISNGDIIVITIIVTKTIITTILYIYDCILFVSFQPRLGTWLKKHLIDCPKKAVSKRRETPRQLPGPGSVIKGGDRSSP
jgi:hypothetical protein